MFRTITLLVVAMMLVSPEGSLACELWCASPAAAGHLQTKGCHHAAGATTTHPLVISTAGCHASEFPLFLSEVRQRDTRVPAIISAYADTLRLVQDARSSHDGWQVLNTRPLGPPPPQILRI